MASAYQEAIAAAERAIALARELGVEEPVRALATAAASRSALGDRAGVQDMRRVLALAVERGQGRAAASLHNNLALALWEYEGPEAALERSYEGLEFCERRGIAEMALFTAVTRLTFLVERGRADEAFAEAGPLAERAEELGDSLRLEARSVQLRVLAERGAGARAASAAERLAADARETGEPEVMAYCFATAARVLAEVRPHQARALLAELEQLPATRGDNYYMASLPDCVRCAHALGDPKLAARLVEGVEPRTPRFGHALTACRAQLAEYAGTPEEAAELYAEAAARWEKFGNVLERAYALLGQGRCLAALAKPKAGEPLREARDLFASMGFAPALAETEALLGEEKAAAV
jgi:hypothetical protein